MLTHHSSRIACRLLLAMIRASYPRQRTRIRAVSAGYVGRHVAIAHDPSRPRRRRFQVVNQVKHSAVIDWRHCPVIRPNKLIRTVDANGLANYPRYANAAHTAVASEIIHASTVYKGLKSGRPSRLVAIHRRAYTTLGSVKPFVGPSNSLFIQFGITSSNPWAATSL